MQKSRKDAVEILANLMRLQSDFIFDALKNRNYQQILIPKRSGDVRKLHAPGEELKLVQEVILQFLYRWKVDARQFGFVLGGSPIRNAKYHIRNEFYVPHWVLKLDLENAFPSVTSTVLRKEYTRVFNPETFKELSGIDEKQFTAFIQLMLDLTTYRERLPQGSPCSPYLLNLVLVWTGVTKGVLEYCEKKGLRASLYGDDFTISAKTSNMWFSKTFFRKINSAVSRSGCLRLNHDKTHLICSRNSAPIITGVKITESHDNGAKLTLTQSTLNHWRGVIHRVTEILYWNNRLPRLEQDGVTFNQALGYVNWIEDVYRESEVPLSVRKPIKSFKVQSSRFDRRRG
ncbi:reverse transcriptase family protein [Patescibacteria group bacterium]|nr:reverse transcriptase family protein [Patescibacteria group bacterium]